MNCLIAVKRVIDFNVKVRVKADGSAVETEHVKMSMNPFDEIALEEAVRLKEAGKLQDILAVSIGPDACQETLRTALARGADRAILVKAEADLEPLNVAKILKCLVQEHQIKLAFLGKQAIDDDCNQTAQMLAGLLSWSQGSNVSKVDWPMGADTMDVTREIDGGLETLRLTLPTVLSADLRLNEPRYISLPNVMKAKSKPLSVITIEELKAQFKLELKSHSKTLKVTAPTLRRQGKKLDSVKELMEKLQFEAKVL